MRNRPQDGTFLNPGTFILWGYLPSGFNQVMKAADLAVIDMNDTDLYNMEFDIMFDDKTNGIRRRLRMTPFLMPDGASAITLGTFATSADGKTRTFTPTKEGNLIAETGALVPSGSGPMLARDVAGMLLTDYYRGGEPIENTNPLDLNRIITLEEGDLFWIVRQGDVQLASDATGTTDGDMLVTSNATSGTVKPAGAIGTSTVAAHESSLKLNTIGEPNRQAVGQARATRTGAGLFEAWLDLPHRQALRS